MPSPASPTRDRATVLENAPIARDTYRLRIETPEIARRIRPGQFVMIRPGPGIDPLLGRPFALYDLARSSQGEVIGIEVVYLVLGRGTAELARRKVGDSLEVWGPLGNGFSAPPAGEVWFVAGGIGQTPFPALGKWWLGKEAFGVHHESFAASPAAKITMFYGVKTADFLAGLDDFRSAGIALEIATDDGGEGRKGFVTDLVLDRLNRGERPAKIVGCGPPPMLKALGELVDLHRIDCDLSLENHMACGFGACFSCVAPIRQADGSIDLRRVCVEGPIFPSRCVRLDDFSA